MRLFSLLTILILSAFPRFAQAQGNVVLFGQGDMKTMYQWEVSSQKFSTQPRWSPSSGAPPLTIEKAVEIATEWIKKKNPEIKNFALTSVAFSVGQAWEAQPSERWYYRIEFQPIVGGQRLYGGQFIAVVLFDGSIVEPRAENRVRGE